MANTTLTLTSGTVAKESRNQEGSGKKGRSCRQDGTGEKSTEQERGRDCSVDYSCDRR